MSEPAISVCIPTHDRARHLPAAIASVLAQTRTDFEVIVSDDASSDATPATVARFRDPRVRYHRNERRLGIAANRNRCLELARGRYIAWLDSDDAWLPPMLETQSALLDTNPGVALAHGAFHVMDRIGRRLPDWPQSGERDAVTSGQAAFAELALCNFVSAPTVLVRRSFHDRAGPYDTTIGRSSTDWDMWLRLARLGDFGFTAMPVGVYRFHGQSVSAATTGNAERLRCDLEVLRRTFEDPAGITDARDLEDRARMALAARAIIEAAEASTAGRGRDASRALRIAMRAWRPLSVDVRAWHLLVGLRFRRFDYRLYCDARALLGRLHGRLEGSHFAESLRTRATVDPAWERELRRVADIVRRLVPRAGRIAVVDKQDPTILHLSGRDGWHFPDRRLMPGGYPPDGGAAVRHLQRLEARGATHIVFPSAAFWWLDHYADLSQYLESRHIRLWSDRCCILYRLDGRTARTRQARRNPQWEEVRQQEVRV